MYEQGYARMPAEYMCELIQHLLSGSLCTARGQGDAAIDVVCQRLIGPVANRLHAITTAAAQMPRAQVIVLSVQFRSCC
jgi:hypothetical protein